MVLEYFTLKRGKKGVATPEKEPAKSPILNEEDEAFLNKIASGSQSSHPPEQSVVILDDGSKKVGREAQVALMDGADQIPLPMSPPEIAEETQGPTKTTKEEKAEKNKGSERRKSYLGFLSRIPSIRLSKDRQGRKEGAENLHTVADSMRTGEPLNETATSIPSAEVDKEQKDMASILDQLSLSAVNNRVFSFSKESERLMNEFTQVLKDLVNGVPTAYDDLEKLLNRSEKQIQGMYSNMPPFLQTLVKSMPAKVTSTLAPQILAATSEKPGADAAALADEGSSSDPKSRKKKKRSRPPPLKNLLSEQGAIAGMLRSILNFLKLRFPAFLTGTNVLMSLAVFLLLFVFWYCHKRGRETRIEKERLAVEDSESDGESDVSDLAETERKSADDPDIRRLEAVLIQPEPAEVPLPATSGKDV